MTQVSCENVQGGRALAAIPGQATRLAASGAGVRTEVARGLSLELLRGSSPDVALLQ